MGRGEDGEGTAPWEPHLPRLQPNPGQCLISQLVPQPPCAGDAVLRKCPVQPRRGEAGRLAEEGWSGWALQDVEEFSRGGARQAQGMA